MKCLSLKQPYAHLLASGKKKVELRKWNTKFRGYFLIHASLNTDNAACKRLDINQEPLTKGGIIGKAYLYDVQYYG
ncbi:MAG: ASCH domain-containing protein, partial [Nitrososphaeraceae archaeon]